MPFILAVGGPKGGVGKSTIAAMLAVIAARILRLRVLVIDCDGNRSITVWSRRAGDLMPFELSDGRDPKALARIRRLRGYDLIIVDLPGHTEESGAFRTLVTDADEHRLVDAVLMPTGPDLMQWRPVVNLVRRDVVDLGVPYRILFAMAPTHHARAEAVARDIDSIRQSGLAVAGTTIQFRTAVADAVRDDTTLLDMTGGRHSGARAAERDYLELAAEVYGDLCGFDVRRIRQAQKIRGA